MDRQHIIILNKNNDYEAWGSLTEICRYNKDFSYYYIRRLKFPFIYKGFSFIKVPFRARNIF